MAVKIVKSKSKQQTTLPFSTKRGQVSEACQQYSMGKFGKTALCKGGVVVGHTRQDKKPTHFAYSSVGSNSSSRSKRSAQVAVTDTLDRDSRMERNNTRRFWQKFVFAMCSSSMCNGFFLFSAIFISQFQFDVQ